MTTPAALLAAAALLGVTHGVEPDHVAGISALARDAAGSAHTAFVGACFAVGHVVVVLAWVAALTLVGRGATAVPDTLTAAGAAVPSVVLGLVAVVLAASGVARLRGRHHHGAVAVPMVGRLGHDHESRGDYLKTGVVGSLFALSPPVSMLAFVAGVVPSASAPALGGAVAAYAAAITLTLAAVGGGLGTVLSTVGRHSERAHGVLELAAAAMVLSLAYAALGGGH